MDLATVLGILISFGLIGTALAMGGNPLFFVDPAAMLIVLGGTLGAALVHYPLPVALRVLSITRKAFATRLHRIDLVIDQFMEFAQRARREGLLSLEPAVRNLDDPFLRKGLQLTIDGLEPDAIREIMESEIAALETRHSMGVDIFNALAAYAPALGLVGTLIGLVQMLRAMNDPSSIGPAMAVALITTFYGVVLANLIFLPLAGKLRHRSKEEVQLMEMQLEGILAIARGENPRIILEKLTCYQPPRERRAS